MLTTLKNLCRKFTKVAGNGSSFLAGSLLTVHGALSLPSPSKELVLLGGSGLAVGAFMALTKAYKNMPKVLIPANVALTVNGVHMMSQAQDFKVFAAGLLLASANSFGGYGTANVKNLFNKITQGENGVAGAAAGAQIALAGLSLNNTELALVGLAFSLDGWSRAQNNNETVNLSSLKRSLSLSESTASKLEPS